MIQLYMVHILERVAELIIILNIETKPNLWDNFKNAKGSRDMQLKRIR